MSRNCNASIDRSCGPVFKSTLNLTNETAEPAMSCNASIDPSCGPVFKATLNQTNQAVDNQTFASQIFGGKIFGGNLFSGIGYPSIIAIVVALVGLLLVMKYGGVGKKVDNTPVSESSKEGEDVKSDTPKDK